MSLSLSTSSSLILSMSFPLFHSVSPCLSLFLNCLLVLFLFSSVCLSLLHFCSDSPFPSSSVSLSSFLSEFLLLWDWWGLHRRTDMKLDLLPPPDLASSPLSTDPSFQTVTTSLTPSSGSHLALWLQDLTFYDPPTQHLPLWGLAET